MVCSNPQLRGDSQLFSLIPASQFCDAGLCCIGPATGLRCLMSGDRISDGEASSNWHDGVRLKT